MHPSESKIRPVHPAQPYYMWWRKHLRHCAYQCKIMSARIRATQTPYSGALKRQRKILLNYRRRKRKLDSQLDSLSPRADKSRVSPSPTLSQKSRLSLQRAPDVCRSPYHGNAS